MSALERAPHPSAKLQADACHLVLHPSASPCCSAPPGQTAAAGHTLAQPHALLLLIRPAQHVSSDWLVLLHLGFAPGGSRTLA